MTTYPNLCTHCSKLHQDLFVKIMSMASGTLLLPRPSYCSDCEKNYWKRLDPVIAKGVSR